MGKALSFLSTVAILTLASAAMAAEPLPPIPPMPAKFAHIKIIQPDSSVPQEITDFVGEWEGVWKYEGPAGQWPGFGTELRRVRLIIYQASSSGKIKALYGIGASPYQDGVGWRKYKAEISKDGEDRYFMFFPPSGHKLVFHLQNGLLKGNQRGVVAIEMQKVK
jgi:hypothetical protein